MTRVVAPALLPVRAEGALTERVRFAAHALYRRATDYVDASDYTYGHAGVTLIYPF